MYVNNTIETSALSMFLKPVSLSMCWIISVTRKIQDIWLNSSSNVENKIMLLQGEYPRVFNCKLISFFDKWRHWFCRHQELLIYLRAAHNSLPANLHKQLNTEPSAPAAVQGCDGIGAGWVRFHTACCTCWYCESQDCVACLSLLSVSQQAISWQQTRPLPGGLQHSD